MDDIPLLIDDYSDKSLLEPSDWIKLVIGRYPSIKKGLPRRCILSFEYTGLERLIRVKFKIKSYVENIGGMTPLYVVEYDGRDYCYSNLCIGGPCSALVLETLYELGIQEAIYIGSVGVLHEHIKAYDVVLAGKAIRDEGLSYHYIPPSKYVEGSIKLYDRVKKILLEKGFRIHEGIIWTTDAAFRETRTKRNIFLDYGAVAVDMEAASLYAVSKYRSRDIIGLFYPSDYLKDDAWISYNEFYDKSSFEDFILNLFYVAIETLR